MGASTTGWQWATFLAQIIVFIVDPLTECAFFAQMATDIDSFEDVKYARIAGIIITELSISSIAITACAAVIILPFTNIDDTKMLRLSWESLSSILLDIPILIIVLYIVFEENNVSPLAIVSIVFDLLSWGVKSCNIGTHIAEIFGEDIIEDEKDKMITGFTFAWIKGVDIALVLVIMCPIYMGFVTNETLVLNFVLFGISLIYWFVCCCTVFIYIYY